MLHFMGAKVLKVPEMQIDQPTAENLSAASLNFLRHFVPVGEISEFAQDTVAFATVLGATYLPMTKAAAERKAREKAAAKAAPPPPGMNSAGGFEPSADFAEAMGNA